MHYICEFLQNSSDVAVIEDLQSFGKKTQVFDDYNVQDESEKYSDDVTSKKRVRVRVPVIRSRSAREHALTVVRRRPLVPYTKASSIESSESALLPTPRRIVTRTRVRNIDSINGENHLSDDVSDELFTKTNRHKVTVTRRRKIRPTAVISSIHRERVTRKKLVTVRPIPEPTSTLAIITTGFYTIPSFDENDEYFESDSSKISTPELYTTQSFENLIRDTASQIMKSNSDLDKPSSLNDPIIITDNFFLPEIFGETTTNENKNNFDDEVSTETNLSIGLTTINMLELENVTDKFVNTEITTEKEAETTTNKIFDSTEVAITTEDNNETTTLIDKQETTKKLIAEISADIKQANTSDMYVSITHDTEIIESNLRVIPIMTASGIGKSISSSGVEKEITLNYSENVSEYNRNADNIHIPTVIPLGEKSTVNKDVTELKTKMTLASEVQVTASLPPLTPEDIEAGLTDDLYLSLSRLDFTQIIPSKVQIDDNISSLSHSSQTFPEIQTSIQFTEKIVTSTRLRTYTYVVTKLNGQETEVTSSTTVRPRVTTLTLTVPATVTVTPTMVSPSVTLSSSLEHIKSTDEPEDEGRKFNLATRVMSNGVEVIVAGTSPAYRWENSIPQPTLTLSEAVVMLLPQEKPNEFVTKTCTTTFTYLNTITRNGTTIVSTDQQVIANTATEERHRKPASEAASVTLEASPTLQTEVFKTTYTYLTLNTDHPDENNALESSTRIIANTVTAPQYYLDMILEPSEAQRPETNTYHSTRVLEKTFIEDGQTKIEKINDIITQLIITESAPPSQSFTTSASITLDKTTNPTTDIAKTFYVTYTYYNTYLDKGSTIVETNVATSSDIVYEKAPLKKTATKSATITATPEPIQIFATKTYLTTYTYFTTLLQTGTDGKVSTTTSSRKKIVENVVTESIAPSLLDAGYMNALLTTAHHSDTLKNVVTGSTIIFFDDEEPVAPTTTVNTFDASALTSIDKIDKVENVSTSLSLDSMASETNEGTSRPVEQDISYVEDDAVEESTDPPSNKKPSQVSNLLSLGSLGINSLSALGPVITAMAGLLQGKTSASRRNDTEPHTEPPITTTQRSPIYIPVAEFVDGDIETAESQNIALRSNHVPETRLKVTSSLADGIPISPGEVITANSDVIIGKHGKMGPRPPQTFLNDENFGMKPPPVSVPNIPVHPVLEVDESEHLNKAVKIQKGSQHLEIFPAHQIYEEHIKVPVTLDKAAVFKRPQNLHQTFLNSSPKVISSKQDILENDPLLIPPSILPNINIDSKSHNFEKNKRPWSPKDPLSASGIPIEEKNRLIYTHKDLIQSEIIGATDGSRIKSHVPEPIVHQVPHVIDRSTGQPLLVNIQPSQVANVVIPQGGTQALIFGDTSEPHITGQYFDDPSPYPEPEVGPGFVGIDKVENLPQFSKNINPADYMTPPSPPSNVKTAQNSIGANRPYIIPLSQDQDFTKNINTISRPEKIAIWQKDNSNLASGQGHVHTEILVHQGSENDHLNPQSRPIIPMRNYQNVQYPPRKEQVKTNTPIEKIPPRRTEVPIPTEHTFYDSVRKNEKKPFRISPTRWPRPTIRPRPPIRITGRPYGRPTRIESSINLARQPQFSYTQRIPQNNYPQKEYNKYNQQLSISTPFADLSQQLYTPEMKNQDHVEQKVTDYHHYGNTNLQIQTSISTQENKDYISEDDLSNTDSEYKISKIASQSHITDKKYPEKTVDSEVDASETVKVTSKLQENEDEDDLITNSENDALVKFNNKNYIINDTIYNTNFESIRRKQVHYLKDQSKVDFVDEGDIIIGSEKKQDHYLSQSSPTVMQSSSNRHNFYNINNDNINISDRNSTHEIIDLRPPAIIPVFELNGHSRPFSKPHFTESKYENKPDITTEKLEKSQNVFQGHIQPGIGQVLHVKAEKNELEKQSESHRNESYSHRGNLQPDYITRTHPEYPQIITKPKHPVPRPVIVSNIKTNQQNINYRRPSMKFSLPIDSTGEENESKTQTERAPSANNAKSKSKDESLDTAFQTNFASTDSNEKKDSISGGVNKSHSQKSSTLKKKLLTHDVVPASISSIDTHRKHINDDSVDEGLIPPPSPNYVLGLSPPPVDITTTIKSSENKSNYQKTSANVSGLKPPPLYIPLKESSVTPPLPSMSMVPPNPRPSVVRPYLADILSQDMVPPPPDMKTTHPLEITTIRSGVAVSGSIQIATAVATSHIPVIQDIESKIPIVHGTVDLPVIVDVPEFLKPIDTKKPDHVSIYTVRPFETRQRNSLKPTISPTSSSSLSVSKQSQVSHEKQPSHDDRIYSATKLPPHHIKKKPSTLLESSIVLEPSIDIHLPSAKIEPTESLTVNNMNKKTKHTATVIDFKTKAPLFENSQISKISGGNSIKNQRAKITNQKIKESASKMMEIIGTVVHEFIQNSTNERIEIKPQEVTRYETLTVTRTETSVIGSPPTTMTLLITRTLTSTRVETVTETLLRPTSVISTITSTVLQSVTHVPAYESGSDNESIFVVMSDQKPPAHGAEEVEAEYGEEDISRDEQDVSGNEIHRVLSGGILGSPSVPIRPPKIQCVPECKASKSEICAESNGEMRCVCRPGFARMFPDRPCKPTYTFTVGIGLDRLGRDRFKYNSEMNDTNSIVFRRYALPIKEALDRTLMQSDLRDVYRSLNIDKFAADPVRVLFNVQLTSNTDETRLKEVIRKYLVMSNYSLGGTEVYASKDLGLIEVKDFDECTNENRGLHHDCSLNAACFNIKGSYQCSCKEGWADLSENPAYPGRTCSQAPLGCATCNNRGHCVVNTYGQEVCECFPWHSGQKCQVNLKVLLIALGITGAILLGLLAFCVVMACFRNPSRRRTSADRRAMISGGGGDTSSEGSVAELAIPHHVPHILPPPPQMVAPAPPVKKAVRKISGKPRRAPRKPAPVIAPVLMNSSAPTNEQRDRSLTVMIPRAKYRSAPQSGTPQNYKTMSTFAFDEHKLIDYLDTGTNTGNRKSSLVSNSDYKESDNRISKQHGSFTPSGALVSAGFQVSATVTRTLDAESTLARSCGETTVEPSTKVIRGTDYPQELESTLVRSCAETTIEASTKQLLRLDLGEAGSTLARSCGETTIQLPIKVADHKDCNRDARDSASEGHTMAERDLGSTLRLPAQHAPMYNQDRTSSDRESNFDSL